MRSAYGRISGWVGIICNALLFLAKGAVGLTSGSISIMADAVNNLSDASSGVINLMGFKLADKPADVEHPYGHGRYEYFAGLTVAVLVLLIGVELVKNSVLRIISPAPVTFGLVSLVMLVASILVKLLLMLFNRKIGGMINSGTLRATAIDSRNDIISTVAVLTASILSRFTGFELDGWMGLAVAVFILVGGVLLIRDMLDPILGRAPDPATVKCIRDKILSYPGVLGTHDLLIHDYGPGRQFASVHVEMAAEANALESHDVIDSIERYFTEAERLHLIVHYDPIITAGEAANNLRTWLSEEIRIISQDFSIHDLRIVPGTTQTKLVFDCLVPPATDMTDGEIRVAISALVKKTYPDYNCAVVIDRDFAAIPQDNDPGK